jgi:hypothetical protein
MAVIEAPEKVEVTIPPDLIVSPRVKEVLTKARDLISLGWTQNQFRLAIEEEGLRGDSYCSVGAIMEASNGHPYRNDLVRDCWEALNLVVGKNLVCWNDDPSRKKEHVIAVFDELIAK